METVNFQFVPANVNAKVGDKILIHNHDTSLHRLVSSDESLDSKDIAHDQHQEVRLTKAGTFPFTCKYHSQMTGTITVR